MAITTNNTNITTNNVETSNNDNVSTKHIYVTNKVQYQLVYNHNGTFRKDGTAPIQIQCYLDKKRIYISTKINVKPNQWDNNSRRVIDSSNSEWANHITSIIYKQKQELEQIECEFIMKNKTYTLNSLKHAYLHHFVPSAKFDEFTKSMLEVSDIKDSTKNNYFSLVNNIEKFKKNTYIADIDYAYVQSYKQWLSKQNLSVNTISAKLIILKTILSEAIKYDVITKNPVNLIKIENAINKHEYIHADELQRIENLTNLKKSYEKVRDLFLFGCYTGLRFSDIVTLSSSNILSDRIKKKMIKTNNLVVVPFSIFNGKAQQLIQKYSSIENLIKNVGPNAKVNQKLKTIFELADIDDYKERKLTFHSSRHTCASLLSENGYTREAIQLILGHTKSATTDIYLNDSKEAKLMKMLS